ncbi:unnamed protein product [Lepeophtheirus salmonis]|uniref:(salmon louse) hypothetical protein n=1 Tax=Lepeophtheirus salmonis TaxID=72036 RepID=A0A7R8CDG3_LEPSM|nr:unnamed protein product [Lepeophtheirus salmonis]CAF2780836.1 unnamed protein product [Lepeophtheirus salmonis]
MNSSFKIKEPSHYYNLGVPSYQRLPFPQDHKIKLFIQPYLNGHKKESSTVSSTTSSKLKTEKKLFVEPYALSIVSKRVSKPLKKEVDEGYNVVNVEEETTFESYTKKSTINSSSPSSSSGVSGVSSPSSKDKVFKSQFSSVSDKRMKESESSSKTDSQTMIKLSNGQFIRVPQSMLVNIELFKQKSQALTVSPVIHQTSVSLSSPSCESIAKVTHEKNGQVIYLKSVPNPKSPTPGATRLIVAQPQPNQRLTTTNIQQVLNQTGTHPGVQLPLKLVNQPASSIEGISTTPRNPVIVKRLIPSDLPRLNSQVNKGKPCSNSVGSPLNDPFVILSNESESPKEVKLKTMVNVKSELDPLLNIDADSKSCFKNNHDYSCTLRGVKLSEALMDISKRGIFVDTTAVKVDSSSCSGQISTVNIQVPQKDLLSFAVSETKKEKRRPLSSTPHPIKFSRKVLNSKSNYVHVLARKGSMNEHHVLSTSTSVFLKII